MKDRWSNLWDYLNAFFAFLAVYRSYLDFFRTIKNSASS